MRKISTQARLSFSVVALIMAFAVGCGGPSGDFTVAATNGTVETVDGEIIQIGKIKLTPISADPIAKAGKPAFGRIEDGQFVLSTYGNGDGAVIGKHKVMLLEGRQPDEEDERPAKSTKHYCEIAPESQTVEIVAGENVLKLKAVPKKRKRRDREDEDD